MLYQLKATIKKFDFKFCNEILSIFIIEKRDENKSTDKLILSLEVICKAKQLYILVNKVIFYSFLGQNLLTTSSVTHINLHCSKVYRNKKEIGHLIRKNKLKEEPIFFYYYYIIFVESR